MDDPRKTQSAIFQTAVAAATARLEEIGPADMPEVANPDSVNRVMWAGATVRVGRDDVVLRRYSVGAPTRFDRPDYKVVTQVARDGIDWLLAGIRKNAPGPVVTAVLPPPGEDQDADVAYLLAGQMPIRLTFTFEPEPRPAFILQFDVMLAPVPAVPA